MSMSWKTKTQNCRRSEETKKTVLNAMRDPGLGPGLKPTSFLSVQVENVPSPTGTAGPAEEHTRLGSRDRNACLSLKGTCGTSS